MIVFGVSRWFNQIYAIHNRISRDHLRIVSGLKNPERFYNATARIDARQRAMQRRCPAWIRVPRKNVWFYVEPVPTACICIVCVDTCASLARMGLLRRARTWLHASAKPACKLVHNSWLIVWSGHPKTQRVSQLKKVFMCNESICDIVRDKVRSKNERIYIMSLYLQNDADWDFLKNFNLVFESL